jgi:hypothetical protein
MKVIGHAGVGGKLNFKGIKRSVEQFKKNISIFFISEYLPPFITPAGHMIKSIWILDS